MAYGEIHNSTGTICKATKSCPIEGGHSKDVDEYIEAKVAEDGIDGDRVRAMVKDGTPAGEAVAIVKEGLDAQISEQKFNFRKPAPSAAIGSYGMTDEKLDINRIYPGQRFYDSDGGAYIVETAQRGSFATLTKIGADGTVPRPKPGADGEIRVTGDPKTSNHLRALEAPKDPRYTDGVAGQSESQAIRELPAEGHWPRSISAAVNFRDENGDQKSVELVAPVERLTDRKRIELGRQLWSFTGQDPQRYEDADDKQKLQWANQRIMRREDYKWKTDEDGTVSYSHRMGGGGSHDGKAIKLVEL